jgi:phage FluMu protein Com
MPIEFRCTQCSKLLRTADDTAGKKAKCPECGTVMTIPEAPAAPAAGSPFGAPPPSSFPSDTGNPYQSPGQYVPDGPREGFRAPLSKGVLDFSDVIGRTWQLLNRDMGPCIVAALVVFVLNFAVSVICGLVPFGGIVSTLFSIWINIGLALFFLKKARGQEAALGEVFNGGPYFLKVFVVSLLLGLVVFGILAVCVGPPVLIGLAISQEALVILAVMGGLVAVGVIWFVTLMFSQYYYLILDRNVDIIESLKMSQRLMEGNKFTLLLIGLVTGILGAVATLLTCGLGVFLVMPYMSMLYAVIYLTVTGQPTAEQIAQGNPFGSLPRMGPVQ